MMHSWLQKEISSMILWILGRNDSHLALLVEIVVPVAMMSGFIRPSRVGPMDEKKAKLAKRSASCMQVGIYACRVLSQNFNKHPQHKEDSTRLNSTTPRKPTPFHLNYIT